ncbi:hypothetical protein AB833_32160 [Chromatiales bacterium (ex Bugula neritina AB1)]|nr:hypothetical protein AB833_32160 [Chromatiales bacterium (ex Bugula neritina AB1)]
MNIIWLSDLHFSAQENVLNHNPQERLSAAIDFINENHSDSLFCLISGDLVKRPWSCIKFRPSTTALLL